MRNAITKDITNAIDQFVMADALFTAYDVTKRIRHSGLHVLHHEVKKVVGYYDMDSHDYERETHDIGTGRSAFVYYPRWEDINNYDPSKVPEFQLNQQNGSSTKTTVSAVNNSNTILDKRGRFTVPAKYVKSIDLRPYVQVTFNNTNGAITIRKADSSDSKSATVDKYWNIRIPRREFETAFNKIPTDAELKIASNNDPVSPEITVFI